MMEAIKLATLLCLGLLQVDTVSGLKVTKICGEDYIRVISVNAEGDTFRLARTQHPDGFTNITMCNATGTGSADSVMVLLINKESFKECGVKMTDGGKKGELDVLYQKSLKNPTYPDDQLYSVKCDFENPDDRLTVQAGLDISEGCATDTFLCPEDSQCKNAKYRCVEGEVEDSLRCRNSSGYEEGCDRNGDGEYNIRANTQANIVQWIEYRGFVYQIKNNVASASDINNLASKSSFDKIRPSYRNVGASLCSYNEIQGYNAWFNSHETGRDNCYDYFKGLQTHLLDSCVQYRSKTGDLQGQYLHKTMLKTNTGSYTCDYESISSAESIILNYFMLFVPLLVNLSF